MKSLTEFIEESLENTEEINEEIEEITESNEDTKYAVVDVDLDDAILSVWDTNEEAKTEIANQLEKNDGLNLKVNPIKASEVEKQ